MNHVTSLRWVAALLLFGTLAVSAYYWWRLVESHRQLRETTMAAANRRALQLADAKAAELDAMILGIDASLRQFRSGYLTSGSAAAESVARSAMRAFPGRAIRFLSVVDANGNLAFTVPETRSMQVGDRDFYAFHRGKGKDELLIDKPVVAKRDGQWTLLVSRPILDGQRFAGVVVGGIAVDYVAGRLAALQIGQGNVVNVFFSDGTYLARSRDWREAMGKVLPPDRPFLGENAPISGVFRVQAMVDNQVRVYAWHRLTSFPLVLSVGLDEDEMLGPVNQAIAQSVRENVIASLVIVLLMFSVGGLLLSNARRQARVLASETLLRSTLNSTYDGIVVVDVEDKVMTANQQFLDLVDLAEQGLDKPEICVGRSFECIYAQLSDPETFKRQRREQGGLDEMRWDAIALKNGRYIEAYGRTFELDGRAVRVWCFHDITERRRHELELKEMATTDGLTGLPNRRVFMSRLQEEIGRAHRTQSQRTALLLLDLDHFKAVNDNYGHVVGDAVLRNFAALLKRELRKIDMAGRLGGEEFGIILVDADMQAALRYAERLRQTVHETAFTKGSLVVPVTVSMGLTLIGQEDAVPDDVLGRVDEALYQAKDKGRNRIELAPIPGSDGGVVQGVAAAT